jgi:hypothetical protein
MGETPAAVDAVKKPGMIPMVSRQAKYRPSKQVANQTGRSYQK